MSVLKNYSYNLLYQITALIVPFATIPYISRIFGAEGVGAYAVSYAIAQYFCLFGLLGLNTYGTRQIAYCRDNDAECRKTFWNLNYMRAITMGITLLLYVAYVILFINKEKLALYICQGFVLWASFFDISWYFYGKEEFKLTAIRNIIVKIAGMILVFILVRNKDDVWIYALIIALTLFIGQIAMWNIPLRRMKIVKPDTNLIVQYLKGTFMLWIPAIAINIYTSLDKVMLGYMTGDAQAGLYENSQHVIRLVSTITTTFATVMTPRMSNLFAKRETDRLRESVYKSFRFVSLLAFPMVFGIIAIRNTFVPWFFGRGFEEISTLLIASAWLVLTLSWSNVIGNQVLIACGKEKYYSIAVTTGAVVNVCMNVILIPKLLCMGAIVSSVVAEYIGMILMVISARHIVPIKQLFTGLPTYLLAAMAMGMITFVIGEILGNYIYTTILQILVGIIVYGAMLLVAKDQFALNVIKSYISRFKQ